MGEKLFREVRQEGKHAAPVKGEDGRVWGAALDDRSNKASGVMKYEEVDVDELKEYVPVQSMTPAQQALTDLLVSTTTVVIEKLMDVAIDKSEVLVKEKVIPAVKKKVKQIKKNLKPYIEGIKAGIRGDKPKALMIMKETDLKQSSLVKAIPSAEKYNEYQKETKPIDQEEAEAILADINACSIRIANDIAKLMNSYIVEKDEKKKLEEESKLRKLATNHVIGLVDDLLKDENCEILDEATLRIIQYFREMDFTQTIRLKDE